MPSSRRTRFCASGQTSLAAPSGSGAARVAHAGASAPRPEQLLAAATAAAAATSTAVGGARTSRPGGLILSSVDFEFYSQRAKQASLPYAPREETTGETCGTCCFHDTGLICAIRRRTIMVSTPKSTPFLLRSSAIPLNGVLPSPSLPSLFFPLPQTLATYFPRHSFHPSACPPSIPCFRRHPRIPLSLFLAPVPA